MMFYVFSCINSFMSISSTVTFIMSITVSIMTPRTILIFIMPTTVSRFSYRPFAPKGPRDQTPPKQPQNKEHIAKPGFPRVSTVPSSFLGSVSSHASTVLLRSP